MRFGALCGWSAWIVAGVAGLGGAGMACGSSASSGNTATGGDGGSEADGSAAGGSDAGAGGGAGGGGDASTGASEAGAGGGPIQTVFVIMEENHSATSIYGNADAPYINKTLLPLAARPKAYNTTIHPSEPNYIWLEAGDNLTIKNDADPAPKNQRTTTDHLVSQLAAKKISWKAYAEDIDGTTCPLNSSTAASGKNFACKHLPQVYFDDVTDHFSPTSKTCVEHVRPFGELATDLRAGNVARYNFIVPNQCNDMHGASSCTAANDVTAGDDWLKANVPVILESAAFKAGGLLLIVWDEGDERPGGASDGPLPFLAIGAHVKKGYEGPVPYSHSSTLKSLETIFGVAQLRGAADPKTHDLSDLFTSFP